VYYNPDTPLGVVFSVCRIVVRVYKVFKSATLLHGCMLRLERGWLRCPERERERERERESIADKTKGGVVC
jgi:hypothetical protein